MLQVLVTLHILSAIWFAGGMIAFVILHILLLKTDSLLERIYYLRIALTFTRIAVVPGGLSAVVFGVALALLQGYDILQTPWLFLSLVLFIYATLMGITYLTPHDRKVLRISQEEQAKSLPGVVSRRLLYRSRILALRLINVLAVLALLLLMIDKPPIFLP